MMPLKITIRTCACSRLVAKTAAYARLTLMAIFLLGAFGRIDAATIMANCSLAAVQAAVVSANPGDTVQVLPGTATWSGTLMINKNIQLIGAGVGQTIITNNVVGSLIGWTTTSNGPCRLSGFQFEHGPVDNTNYWSSTYAISISGTCHAFRMDNCLMNGIGGYQGAFTGWVYGVVDHCRFILGNWSSGFEVQMQNYGGYEYGDGSWADPDSYGTTNALYFEDDVFTSPIGYNAGMLDGYYGHRVAIRYSNITNCTVASHGTDNGGRPRGMRHYEIYANNFLYQTNEIWPVAGMAIQVRSGTALVWSNSVMGGYAHVAALSCYRYVPVTWPPFGNVTGVNPWDSNNPTLFESGSATGTNNSPILIDAGKNWTVNQWVATNPAAPYMLYNVSQGISAVITANTFNAIKFNGSFQGFPGNNSSGTMVIKNGDTYQIRQVFAALDQCGFGQGDLITNRNNQPINSRTGTAAWPNQVSDPVYLWGNQFSFVVPGFPSSLVSGNVANYVTGIPKPGYTPLVYPHPLVSGIGPPPSTNPPSIVSQPASQVVMHRENISLAVSATGTGLGYCWMLNNTVIPGATNSNLTIGTTDSTPTDNRYFSVVVTNPYGSVTSSIATVKVVHIPPDTYIK